VIGSFGGNVSTSVTGVAFCASGGVIALVTDGSACWVSVGSPLNSMVNSCSTERYSTLP
jgi:hypothetical protein